MSIIIDKECLACGSCIDICPANAIVKSEDIVKVIMDKCINCYVCMEVCPQVAIKEEVSKFG